MKFPPKSVWQPIAIGLGIFVLFTATGAVVYSMYQGKLVKSNETRDLLILGDRLVSYTTETDNNKTVAGQKSDDTLQMLQNDVRSLRDKVEFPNSLLAKHTLRQILSEGYLKNNVSKSEFGNYVFDLSGSGWMTSDYLALPSTIYQRYSSKFVFFDSPTEFDIRLTDASQPYDIELSAQFNTNSELANYTRLWCRDPFETGADDSSGDGPKDVCQVEIYPVTKHATSNEFGPEVAATSVTMVSDGNTMWKEYDRQLASCGADCENDSRFLQSSVMTKFYLERSDAGYGYVTIQFSFKPEDKRSEVLRKKIDKDIADIQKAIATERANTIFCSPYAGCY